MLCKVFEMVDEGKEAPMSDGDYIRFCDVFKKTNDAVAKIEAEHDGLLKRIQELERERDRLKGVGEGVPRA